MSVYDRGEIERILDQYGDMIYRMAFIQVKNRDAADDLYQEVCLKLVRQKKKVEPEEHLKAWLLRTTINCCKDYWKSAWLQKISWKEEMEENVERGGVCVPDTAGGSGQEMGYITECVQKLPEKYRIVIHLYYYEDYSQKEIAKLLGKKENTIASQLARGRELLKKQIQGSSEVNLSCYM